MPYAKDLHNIITANMTHRMMSAFDDSDKNYIVFPSDQMVYMPALDSGVYADALAVAERPIYWDSEQLLLINPIIVVEVLSKSTQKRDRTSKFEEYKTLESFREYILIRQNICAKLRLYFDPKKVFGTKLFIKIWMRTLFYSRLVSKIPMKKIYKKHRFSNTKMKNTEGGAELGFLGFQRFNRFLLKLKS
ncbi:MAG: Uma2 family endonuclease [Saprospiraceae bacterium]|nr:Uma2 family endonuclease [Saprospiraceae bacterium]